MTISRPEGFRSELLLKLFLGGRLPVEETRRHILTFQERQRDLLRTYETIARQLRREHARHPDLPYWLVTLRYGQRRAGALVRWADEALRTLERLRRRRPRPAPAR